MDTRTLFEQETQHRRVVLGGHRLRTKVSALSKYAESRTRDPLRKFFGQQRWRELIIARTDHERGYADSAKLMPQIVRHDRIETAEFDLETGKLRQPRLENCAHL